MKITQETGEVLVLKDNNYSGIFLGLIISVLGLGLLVASFSFLNVSGLTGVLAFIWIPLIVLIIGFFKLKNSYLTTITLDKSKNKITLDLKRIFDKKIHEYDIREVSKITVNRVFNARNRSLVPWGKFQLILNFKNGSKVALDRPESDPSLAANLLFFLSWSGGFEKEMGKKIAEFLNLPFEEPQY